MIREITSAEIPFLKDMLFASLFAPPGIPPFERPILEHPDIAKYISDWGSQTFDYALVAADANKELIGAIWARTHPKTNPGFGFIAEDIPEIAIAVKEEHRNQGIGTQLIEALAQACASRRVKALSLSVNKQNPAKVLYERTGFVVVSESEHGYTMKREL